MNKLFEQLAEQRGLDEDFLNPQYEDLMDPFGLPDMKKAIQRIAAAVKDNERVLVYGDYDADGVTASTVMHDALRMAGVKEVEIMLPDRFADGYGMSVKVIERAKEIGAKLVVTVDCGSANHDIIDELKVMGVDTVVTDHHECPQELPEAVAVINPKRQDYQGFRDLAGVGVAFMVALGLMRQGLIRDGQEKWLLDLVLIGTICDAMPLIRENRILGYFGMKVLKKTRRVGLRELMKKAGVKTVNSESIGFQIGPRLNAAGRLATAELALDLLMTQSGVQAVQLAERLEELNLKRKSEQKMATEEINQRGITAVNGEEDRVPAVIVEVGKWHEGILGIVAGKIMEQYRRPTFVLTEIEGGFLKGSGRSFGDFSLAQALDACREWTVSGGGHAGACGVRIEKTKIWQFREKVNAYYEELQLRDQERYWHERADVTVDNLADCSLELMSEMQGLEPYGFGNQEPIFQMAEAEVVGCALMGQQEQHLRLDIRDKHNQTLKLVAFFAPENWKKIRIGQRCRALFRLTENEWQGYHSVEGRIVELYDIMEA